MFARFRQTLKRLQVSLVETRRLEGKVRAEHIASLGSIVVPWTVADRIAFWTRLHERLGRLSNRLDAAKQGEIIGAVYARIPLPTPDEQRALQLENAETDERLFSQFEAMFDEKIGGEEALVAKTEAAIAADQTTAADIKTRLSAARDRIARLNNGEAVAGGLGKPVTYEDALAFLRAGGWTKADIKRSLLLSTLSGEEFEEFLQEARKRDDRRSIDNAALAEVLKRRGMRRLQILREALRAGRSSERG